MSRNYDAITRKKGEKKNSNPILCLQHFRMLSSSLKTDNDGDKQGRMSLISFFIFNAQPARAKSNERVQRT